MSNNGHFDIYLICPVTNITLATRDSLLDYVSKLEREGQKVYNPLTDSIKGLDAITRCQTLVGTASNIHIY